MADRRKQQNYTAIASYLPASIWNGFEALPRERCQSMLLQHAWLLGLRCPSEPTFAMLQNLLLLGVKAERRQMTTFQRYEDLQELKKCWRRFKMAKGKDADTCYSEYLECLPCNVPDLPAEYHCSAFASEEPEPCRSFAALYLFTFASSNHIEWCI
jgi:hypothetical protein